MSNKHKPVATSKVRQAGTVDYDVVRCVPSYCDTPEEVFEHFRQTWSDSMAEIARCQQVLRDCPREEAEEARRELEKAQDMERHWKYQFETARYMIESYRREHGNGTLIPVEGRRGVHNLQADEAAQYGPLISPYRLVEVRFSKSRGRNVYRVRSG